MYLPEEIITQILINLPVKSLLRFCLVSKSWLALTCSPQFIKSHLLLPTRTTFALSRQKETVICTRVFSHGQKPLEILQLREDSKIRWLYQMDIVGSCNGLVCAVVSGPYNFSLEVKPYKQIILWNPATKKFKELPSSGSGSVMCNKKHGFGYDASTDDYKVVESGQIIIDHKMYHCLHVYSLNSNIWRPMESNANGTIGSSVFVNGSIHWETWLPDDDSPESFNILAINLTTETCIVMAGPNSDSCIRGDFTSLRVSEDYLCYSCSNNDCIDYWMMKEYGVQTTWTKILRIQYDPERPFYELGQWFEVPEYDESSGKSREMWMVEKVCCFDEIPWTSDYVRFDCAIYKESIVAV